MRRGTGFFLLITAGMVITVAAPGARSALSSLELFRVATVSIEGTRYLMPDEVLAVAAIASDASVWDDRADLEARLLAHPMVSDAVVRRRLPRGLLIEVTERDPVGLVPAPALTPVDRYGRLLPLDPSGRSMDLPLVQVREETAAQSSDLPPAQVRLLTEELARLGSLHPEVSAAVSEVALDAWGGVVLHLHEPRLTLRYWPPLVGNAVTTALAVLTDALDRRPEESPISVDLRFEDQVVVRYGDPGRR